MQRREPPTPAGERLLKEIRRLSKPGAVVTQGMLAQTTGQPKNTIADVLNRLESGGWIKRARHRPGLSRSIILK